MLADFWVIIRPKHWIKNVLVLAPLIFSLQTSQQAVGQALLAFVCFCLTASSVYCLNDLADASSDRLHPEKKKRPVAARRLGTSQTLWLTAFLLLISFAVSLLLPITVRVTLLAYIAINLLYSFGLKKVLVLDVMLLSLGFVLRVVAGGLAIQVPISSWILLCTFFVALFMGFGKRKHENGLLQTDSKLHRSVLEHYTPDFLNQMIGVTATMTVMSYTLYTIDPKTINHFGTDQLVYTIPVVVYGVFRYFHLIYNKALGGDPTKIFLRDRPIILAVAIWLALFIYLAHLA